MRDLSEVMVKDLTEEELSSLLGNYYLNSLAKEEYDRMCRLHGKETVDSLNTNVFTFLKDLKK